MIRLLNPIIKGWANYHRTVVAKETFKRVDREIWQSLWQWAKRGHPDKGPVWIRGKYFKTLGNRNWVFAAEDMEMLYPNGKPFVVTLFSASDIPIKRYIKIKGGANPFDPKVETYFEERMTSKLRGNLKRDKRLLSLWLTQGGNCPVCGHTITDDMQWQLHYINRKVAGGSSNLSNLNLTHYACHRIVHDRKLDVVEPVAKAAYERLEPCVGKLTSTVLMGLEFSNELRLPDWLVDLLMEEGYSLHLANPSRVQ